MPRPNRPIIGPLTPVHPAAKPKPKYVPVDTAADIEAWIPLGSYGDRWRLRVGVVEWDGRRSVEIRRYGILKTGEWRPTRRGVTVPLGVWPQFTEIVQRMRLLIEALPSTYELPSDEEPPLPPREQFISGKEVVERPATTKPEAET